MQRLGPVNEKNSYVCSKKISYICPKKTKNFLISNCLKKNDFFEWKNYFTFPEKLFM